MAKKHRFQALFDHDQWEKIREISYKNRMTYIDVLRLGIDTLSILGKKTKIQDQQEIEIKNKE